MSHRTADGAVLLWRPSSHCRSSKILSSLRMDIEAGPKGPRARMRTLQSDLQSLKSYFFIRRTPDAISEKSCGFQKHIWGELPVSLEMR
jgi:hypothetical protein